MKRLFVFIGLLFMFSGCYSVGHQDFLDYRNSRIGTKTFYNKPLKFTNTGKIKRGDFLLSGQGLTHISKDKDGNLIYHWDEEEVLSIFKGNPEWIGKCKTYDIVHPKTKLIIGWGFDKGGNPQSCRTWP